MTVASLRNLVCTSALVLLPILSSIAARADMITVTTSGLSTVALDPSNDTISFAAGDTVTAPGTGITLASGIFYVGNSPIPDQVIPFSFDQTITVNGVSQTVRINGEDDVTTSVDIFKIFAGSPISFGDVTLTIDEFTSGAGGVDATLPLELNADLSQTPEPSSLALLATGVLGAAVTLKRRYGRA